MYKLSQIAEITDSVFKGKINYSINHFLNDSRNLQSPADSMFVALKTTRNNGHHYIQSLIDKGVKSFLIQENEFNYQDYKDSDVSFVLSHNPLKTLQNLAAYHRQQFSIPVIGITGSNGKTVVKEWLYQLLKKNYSICRSPKSYNSQVGVPLSVLNLNATHTLAIFEAGISQTGEMEQLASIIRPTIGILTSLGTAHDEGFESSNEKLQEKSKLLEGCDVAIINGESLKSKLQHQPKTSIYISEGEEADVKIKFNAPELMLKSGSGDYKFNLPFTDMASVSNASTCAIVLKTLGFNQDFIAAGLGQLQPVALRLEIKNGIHNSLLINDFYNSDLDSFRIALNYLQQQNRRQRKIVIVSDIEQSGITADALYRNLAELLTQSKVDLVIGIGRDISNHKPLFKTNSLFFADTKSFIGQLKFIDYQLSNAGILLKGARSFGFENISRLLQQKSHDTVFEINLNKLTDNVNYYRSLLAPNVKLMCMVKAMGYGSGGAEIARTLQHIGVDYLAVAYADEGVELRQSQIELPVMVMNPEEDAFDDIINYRLEPEIYNFRILDLFIQHLDASGITEPYPIHLKIDTGMHRLGFEEREIERLITQIKSVPQLRVRSVFSHLSASDNPNLDDFTNEQIQVFENVCGRLEKELAYSFIKHICNSAGISRHKQAHYNMVRLGIGMYGIGIDEKEQLKLQNVGSLKTRISQIKNISGGQTVSYNRSGKITEDARIATLPLGYADGFSRALGNGKHGVYINGVFCKTVGNVCMDMCMVDVSAVNCSEGDEAVIFENVEQINRVAKALGSIPYEALTNVSGRVKRIYVQE
ncbi:MAG: bifunctional UDP-N-acetylmuramoyl-tripeptide:D-alanyl-D-alanine ligase/alanine racemase [Bacteroidia bacterium]|nr:bifunctional UDP-N-acetylmuramoyl-tripeptide:D-alanyl-D-alanine ligase/alanine racemase [Bacteroidia bacterium]